MGNADRVGVRVPLAEQFAVIGRDRRSVGVDVLQRDCDVVQDEPQVPDVALPDPVGLPVVLRVAERLPVPGGPVPGVAVRVVGLM